MILGGSYIMYYVRIPNRVALSWTSCISSFSTVTLKIFSSSHSLISCEMDFSVFRFSRSSLDWIVRLRSQSAFFGARISRSCSKMCLNRKIKHFSYQLILHDGCVLGVLNDVFDVSLHNVEPILLASTVSAPSVGNAGGVIGTEDQRATGIEKINNMSNPWNVKPEEKENYNRYFSKLSHTLPSPPRRLSSAQWQQRKNPQC